MERLRTVTAELASQAGITPSCLAAEFCLSWDELQDLAREPDVTIGAHTLSHPILTKLHTTAAVAGDRRKQGATGAPAWSPGQAFCLPLRRSDLGQ